MFFALVFNGILPFPFSRYEDGTSFFFFLSGAGGGTGDHVLPALLGRSLSSPPRYCFAALQLRGD